VIDAPIPTFIRRIAQNPESPLLWWDGATVNAAHLLARVEDWKISLNTLGVTRGAVVGFMGDFSPASVALFLALLERDAVLVPFTRTIAPEVPKLAAIAGVEFSLEIAPDDSWEGRRTAAIGEPNSLITELRQRQAPGLVLFSSGSTGVPKGVLHDCHALLQRFGSERPAWRTVLFLLMDHIGGFNTLMSVISNRGMAICLKNRTPESVCRAIETTRAELLPTSPTFLNLLHSSNAWRNADLSSVRFVTYGTEVMSESTLRKALEMFPEARLKQTYGLSELGIMSSRSESNDSTWLKVGGEGYETRIIDNVMWIRARSSMIGYLNAPNPFDEDGWFCTGDVVDVKGDFIRFLGRKSEIINVGGQKVYPAEVETVLLSSPIVREATVYAAPHPLLGQAVCADITLSTPEEFSAAVRELRALCRQHLARYKVPARFRIVEDTSHSGARFKKIRRKQS